MLNKLQFNNMVISNKSGIQQARLQTINKLVNKIRKLKTLLDKRPEDTKCKTRIRKSSETMEILKKLKRVDIMKEVLLLEKPPTAVITNGLSTPMEMAVAFLTMNKVMAGLIKRFKTELKLMDATSNTWRDELNETSKRKQKLERTEEKKRKRIALKEQKAVARKRQEWMEQNCQEGEQVKEEPFGAVTNISTTCGWKIEEIEEPVLQDVTQDNKINIPKPIQQQKRPLENKKTKYVKNESTKKQNIQIKTTEVKKFKENHFSEDEVELADSSQNIVSHEILGESRELSEETLVVDPFFVTETGENYLSTAVARRQHLNEDEREAQDDLHMIKLNGSKQATNYRERKQYQQTKYPQKQNKWNDEKYPQRQNNWNKEKGWGRQNEREPKQEYKERIPLNSKPKSSNISNAKLDDKLHPSWAAKMKCKPVITSFQGKKITFDDNDNIKVKTGNIPFNNNTKNNRKEQSSQNTNTDSLHPSWAAKQKQRPIITAFAGKKITFDNNNE